MEHVVKSGQTLSEIANIFNTSIADICQANNIEDVNIIKVDQVLIIPNSLNKENIKEKVNKFINFIESKKDKKIYFIYSKKFNRINFSKMFRI